MKRKSLGLLLSALLILPLFTGCRGEEKPGGQSSVPQNGPSEERRIASQLVLARSVDGNAFDPIQAYRNEDIWVQELMYDCLVRSSDDGQEDLMNLAESYTVSDDGLTYTFKLVPGIKFSDGSDVTAEDWVYSLNRLKEFEDCYWHGSAEQMEEITAPDKDTLVIKLAAPRPAFITELGMFSFAVVSKADGEANYTVGDKTYVPVGTGPYVLKEWKVGEYVLYEKNPYYRGEVKSDSIKILTVADDNSRMMMLQSGDVDIVLSVPYSHIAALQNSPDVRVESFEASQLRQLVFNVTKPPFDNIKLRQALYMAIDKQQLVDMVTQGYGVVGSSYLSPGVKYRVEGLDKDGYNPEKAKQLLAEAGYPDGLEIEMMNHSGNVEYEQIATILKDQWSKIGVDLKITTVETGSLWDMMSELKQTMTIGRWAEDMNDPMMWSNYCWVYKVSDGNSTGYKDDKLEAYALASDAETDEAKRAEMYKTLQEVRYELCVDPILYYAKYVVAMNKDVEGFWQTPLGKYRLNDTCRYE